MQLQHSMGKATQEREARDIGTAFKKLACKRGWGRDELLRENHRKIFRKKKGGALASPFSIG